MLRDLLTESEPDVVDGLASEVSEARLEWCKGREERLRVRLGAKELDMTRLEASAAARQRAAGSGLAAVRTASASRHRS